MSNYTPPLRSGMTAIAAVIALSSTAALAQATDAAAGQAAPVVASPPAPEAAAPATPPATAQVAVPEASPAAPAPSPAAPPMRTMSTPVEHGADTAADSVAAPVRRSSATNKVSASMRTVAAPAQSVTRAEAPRSPVPTQPVASTQPALAKTAAAAPATEAAPPAPAPAAQTSAVQTSDQSRVDATPVAGAVGLGLLAIGGIAFALRRKRRADEKEELALEPTPAEAVTVRESAPLAAAPRAAVPTPATGQSSLPNGFDLSRFGPHTQAAYRGPTPDNPSLSLKHRLRRASFFDQREREAAAAGIAPAEVRTAEPVAARAAAAPVKREEDQLTVRLTPRRNSYAFGYVFQK